MSEPSAHADAIINLPAAIDAAVERRLDRLVRFRRRLHAEPEPSGEEVRTSALIAETLADAGFEPRVMDSGVGVVADFDIGAAGPSRIALRADIDCVPVQDEKRASYRSTRDGLCHACGHDVHTTVLLGVAKTLHKCATNLASIPPRHNLRFIFQPAEETATGARSMINQGALDSVAGILALHVDPLLSAGTVGMRNGFLTASCKRFVATIRGRGGHSARPNEAIDPVAALAALINQFYLLGPRSVDARDPLVITVSHIEGGATFNVIPDDACCEGTLRALSPESSNTAQAKMEAIAQGVERATGCTISLDFDKYCPPTDNDAELNAFFERAVREALGDEAVHWIARPSLGGEDFSFYQELLPGAMVRLGAALPAGRETPLHSSHFDVDESAIGIGVRVLCRAAIHAAIEFAPRHP